MYQLEAVNSKKNNLGAGILKIQSPARQMSTKNQICFKSTL